MKIDSVPNTLSVQELQRYLEKLVLTLKNQPIYLTGTWTPTLTFATPGDLSVSYASQTATYTRYGRMIHINCWLNCTPTFTTASGAVSIPTLPYTSANSTVRYYGSVSGMNQYMSWGTGITSVVPVVYPNETAVKLEGNGSTKDYALLTTANFTSGQAVLLAFSLIYEK